MPIARPSFPFPDRNAKNDHPFVQTRQEGPGNCQCISVKNFSFGKMSQRKMPLKFMENNRESVEFSSHFTLSEILLTSYKKGSYFPNALDSLMNVSGCLVKFRHFFLEFFSQFR